jgi:hypothetical protein
MRRIAGRETAFAADRLAMGADRTFFFSLQICRVLRAFAAQILFYRQGAKNAKRK